MACGDCGGYYYCKCDLLKVKYEIKIKKLELDSLELQKLKLEEKYSSHSHARDEIIDEENWKPYY